MAQALLLTIGFVASCIVGLWLGYAAGYFAGRSQWELTAEHTGHEQYTRGYAAGQRSRNYNTTGED